MRVGLLADTHDRVPAIRELTRVFSENGIGLVLHAGDYCSSFALQALLEARMALAGVFGRNDGDREALRAEAAKGVGTEMYESPHSVLVNGTRLLLVHDIGEVQPRSVEAHDVVVHGYTHRQETRTDGKTLIVNPGEACGWLFGVPRAAILDLETKHVELIALTGKEWNW